MADGEGSRGLSDQQRRFADFILQGKTQIDAHRLAGYKGKNDNARAASASEILRNPNVAEYLAAKREKVSAKAELSAEHFAKRLERIASAAERALFPDRNPPAEGEDIPETLDVTIKDAADIARAHTMDAAKLLGKIVDKASVTHVVTHEDRLERVREKLNGRTTAQPTTQ